MKELNKRMIVHLPENRIKQAQKEMELRRQTDYSKRKEKMDNYTKKLKENVIANYHSNSNVSNSKINQSVISNTAKSVIQEKK